VNTAAAYLCLPEPLRGLSLEEFSLDELSFEEPSFDELSFDEESFDEESLAPLSFELPSDLALSSFLSLEALSPLEEPVELDFLA
jgi:hypothetical protein